MDTEGSGAVRNTQVCSEPCCAAWRCCTNSSTCNLWWTVEQRVTIRPVRQPFLHVVCLKFIMLEYFYALLVVDKFPDAGLTNEWWVAKFCLLFMQYLHLPMCFLFDLSDGSSVRITAYQVWINFKETFGRARSGQKKQFIYISEWSGIFLPRVFCLLAMCIATWLLHGMLSLMVPYDRLH